MQKKNYKPNKYDIEIDNLLKMRKKELNKIKLRGGIIAIIGLLLVLYTFINSEYALYTLLGGMALVSIGTGYGDNRIKAINKYVNSQIRTIEDEETRDRLRRQKWIKE